MRTGHLIAFTMTLLAGLAGIQLATGQGFGGGFGGGGGFGPVGGFGSGPIGGVGAIGGARPLPSLPGPGFPGGHFPSPPGGIIPPTPELPAIPVHPAIDGDWHHGSWRWYWARRQHRRWIRGRWSNRAGLRVYQNPFADYHVKKPRPPEVGTKAANDAAAKLFVSARAAFKKRDYTKAYREVAKALELKPEDRAMLEFRALTHFARHKYRDAAADLHQVLATGPGWDWTTMFGLYRNAKAYESQLRALEKFREKHPDNSEARFVLSYHYLTEQHGQAAVKELTEYQRLNPGDDLARDILDAASAPDEDPDDAEPESPALPKSFDYHGTWTAESPEGGMLRLDLKEGAVFALSYIGKDGAQDFEGDFAFDGSRLLLEDRKEGPVIGSVTIRGDDEFELRLAETKKEEPGLKFKRSK